MRGKCLDEGILQSYLDGELSPQLMSEAGAHLSACAACADALSAAESETALFTAAFAGSEELSVPTERLRARIDAGLAQQAARGEEPRKGTVWSFGAIAAWLAAPFNAQPRFAGAFASLVALVALAAIFGLVFMREPNSTNVADTGKESSAPTVQNTTTSQPPQELAKETQTPTPEGGENDEIKNNQSGASQIIRVAGNRNSNRTANAASREKNKAFEKNLAGVALDKQAVPGEENYLRTIASLSNVIQLGGDAALKPSFRVEYERNLAVIDKAIEETRRTAARNPKDADAAQFLFSAYQTKIDLLSTVAEQTQVTALGR